MLNTLPHELLELILSYLCQEDKIREAFKKNKKKNVTNVTLGWGGGGLPGQNVTLTKVVFKIHFKPF